MTDEDRRFLKGMCELHPDSPKNKRRDEGEQYSDEEHTPLTETPAWIFEPSASEPEADEEWEEYCRWMAETEPVE